MIKKYVCSVFFIFFFSLSGQEFNPEDQVAKVIDLTKKNHSEAWPSLDLNDSPIVLTFPKGEIYAIHLKKPQKTWNPILIGQEDAHKAIKDSWRLKELKLHPAYDIDGENVFVFQLSEEDVSLRILAHERFHRYQLLYFKPDINRVDAYTDQFNPDNLALMRVEDALLKQFLTSSEEERREILKDYLAVNAERKSIISESSLLWEDHQQKMEGLADYVSAKMFDGEQQISGNMSELDSEGDFSDYAIKWRHYSAGAALAFALDSIEAKNWKMQIEEGAYLREILEAEINETKEIRKERFKRVKRKYHLKALKSKMAKKVKAYQEQMNSLFYKYQAIEGPIVRLGHPFGVGISGGGSTDQLISLADGTILSIKDASFSSTTDSNWKFATSNIPFLIQHRAGFREFKVEQTCSLKINDEKISIKDLMNRPPCEYPFNALSLEGENFNFSSDKHAGVIIFEGDHIAIKYF